MGHGKTVGMVGYFTRAGKVAGPVGATGGLLADVASPLASFSLYLALLTGFIAVLSAYFWFSRDKKELKKKLETGKIDKKAFEERATSNHWAITFSSATIFCIIMTTFAALGYGEEKNRGFLASNVKAIEKIQNSLFAIQKDVKVVKEGVKKIQKDVGDIKEASKKIASGVEKIKKQGGIIESPEKASEFLHNAGVYKERNDKKKALEAYENYFKSNPTFLDPHLSYQSLLKDRDGISATRRKYRKFLKKYPQNTTVKLAAALLLEDKERRKKLTQLHSQSPQHLPILAYLAREYSPDMIGSPTINHQKKEWNYLQKFHEKSQKDSLLSYFLNKREGEKLKEDLLARYRFYKKTNFENRLKNTIKISSNHRGDTTYLTIIIQEIAEEIWYRLPSMKNFKSTGFMDSKNPQTDKPYPQPAITASGLKPGPNKIWVKYQNLQGEMNGPFEVEFQIKDEKTAQADLFVKYQWPTPITKKFKYRYFRGRLQSVCFLISSTANYIRQARYSLDNKKVDQFLYKNGKKVGKLDLKDLSPGSHTLYLKVELVNGWETGLMAYPLEIKGDKKWRTCQAKILK